MALQPYLDYMAVEPYNLIILISKEDIHGALNFLT